ncbi:MAG: MATE family efflux transporter [Myxococcota bacterium]|nr:MATE family efflux transporter [Myxococcota bacterium]
MNRSRPGLVTAAHVTHEQGASAWARELGALLRLSLPISFAQLGLMTMSLVDTAAIGRVSVDDLAGAGIGRSIGFAGVMLGIGVASGLEPLAAQAVGAGEHGLAWRSFVTNARATLLVWPIGMAAAFAVTLALPRLGLDPHVVSRVRLYLAGQAPGFAATLLFFSTKTFLQTHGNTSPAVIASITANVLNVPAANVLVRGDGALRAIGLPPVGLPALGALGGGIAFSLASFVLLAFVAVAALPYRSTEAAPPIPLAVAYRLGLPVGLQMLAEVGVFTVVALLSGALGPVVASAHHIAIGLASFTFMAALGVSAATSVRVGRAIGAGASPRLAGTMGIVLGGAAMTFGAVVFATAPRALMRVFTSNEQVIGIGLELLRIAALFQIFDGVQAVAAGALRGAGDVRFPFVANVVAHWVVGFPAAMVLGFGLRLGARGLWWGLTAGLVFVSVLLAVRFAVVTRHAIGRVAP